MERQDLVYMSNLRPEHCSIVCIAGLRKRESMVDTTSVSSTLPELTRARALIRRSKFGAERPTTRPPVRQGTRTSGLMSHDRSCPIIPANPWPPPGTGEQSLGRSIGYRVRVPMPGVPSGSLEELGRIRMRSARRAQFWCGAGVRIHGRAPGGAAGGV